MSICRLEDKPQDDVMPAYVRHSATHFKRHRSPLAFLCGQEMCIVSRPPSRANGKSACGVETTT
eukprot:5365355-Pleurochrysis_carterae.AAC.3